jgi:hypothetical protein
VADALDVDPSRVTVEVAPSDGAASRAARTAATGDPATLLVTVADVESSALAAVGSSLNSLVTASANTTWLAGTKQALVAAGAPSSVADDLAIGSGSDRGNGGNNLDVGSEGACGSNNVRCVVPGVIGGVLVVGLAGFIAYKVAKRSKARNAYRDDARAFDFANIQMDENITLERPMPSGSPVVPQPGPARASGDPDGAPLSFPRRLPGEVSVDGDVQLQRPASPVVRDGSDDPSLLRQERLKGASAASAAAAADATHDVQSADATAAGDKRGASLQVSDQFDGILGGGGGDAAPAATRAPGQDLFDAWSPRDGPGAEAPTVGAGMGDDDLLGQPNAQHSAAANETSYSTASPSSPNARGAVVTIPFDLADDDMPIV